MQLSDLSSDMSCDLSGDMSGDLSGDMSGDLSGSVLGLQSNRLWLLLRASCLHDFRSHKQNLIPM